MSNCRVKLNRLVAECNKCSFVDKPFIKFNVYTTFLPPRVRVLIVVESPPPGFKDNFFYNLSLWDRLRNNFKLILGLRNISDSEFINYLMKNNVFLTDAIKCRPLSKDDIPSMRENCVYILLNEITILKPEIVVAFGKTATRSLKELKPKIHVGTILKFYHPNYIVRFERGKIEFYRRVLRQILFRGDLNKY